MMKIQNSQKDVKMIKRQNNVRRMLIARKCTTCIYYDNFLANQRNPITHAYFHQPVGLL